MARLSDRDTGQSWSEAAAIESALDELGIWYRRIEPIATGADAPEAALEAYREPIRQLEIEAGYTTADVVDVDPDTPDLDAMMRKFQTEHTHAEDEVRIITAGRGLFHVHPDGRGVFSIEVEAGDMINVPAGMRHWFHLCSERRIQAIRLFQDSAGWVPEYTASGVDSRHEPLCFSAPGAGGA